MRVGLISSETLPATVRAELDCLIVALQASWQVEHDGDTDTHLGYSGTVVLTIGAAVHTFVFSHGILTSYTAV